MAGWSEAITEIFRFFNNLISGARSHIRKVVNIYDSMHKILDETQVERFIIFKAHNGGGFIRPNTPLYVSAIYEDYTHPFHSVKDSLQKLEVDEGYLRMLASINTKNKVIITTATLEKGFLKDLYESEGVKYAEIYYLGQDRKSLYFCSAASSFIWEDNSYNRAALNLGITKIRNNIK